MGEREKEREREGDRKWAKCRERNGKSIGEGGTERDGGREVERDRQRKIDKLKE